MCTFQQFLIILIRFTDTLNDKTLQYMKVINSETRLFVFH